MELGFNDAEIRAIATEVGLFLRQMPDTAPLQPRLARPRQPRESARALPAPDRGAIRCSPLRRPQPNIPRDGVVGRGRGGIAARVAGVCRETTDKTDKTAARYGFCRFCRLFLRSAR